jgi:hypothetical protein
MVAEGSLRVHFNPSQHIDMLEFSTNNHKDYVTRTSINELIAQGSPELMKTSPGSKAMGKQPQRVPPAIPEDLADGYGMPRNVMSLLEVRSVGR